MIVEIYKMYFKEINIKNRVYNKNKANKLQAKKTF